MSKFWSSRVKELVPYVPGEQPKMANLVKLNTNENPFGPSPKVIEAINTELNDSLRLYPDPESEALKSTIAKYYGVQGEQVFLGNGSDEVLAHIFYGLFQHGEPVLYPDITYSFYPVYCGLYNIEGKTVPLTDSFEIDPKDYKQPNGGIIFPNPMRPLGVTWRWIRLRLSSPPIPTGSWLWMKPMWISAARVRSSWWGSIPIFWSVKRCPRPAPWPGCASVSPSAARRSSKP